MKRQIMTVLALVGIVLLAGCKKQQAITPTTGTQITFTASTDGGEKTTLGDGGKVLWSLYDAIKVYNNAGGSGDFTLSNGEGETSATFSGIITGSAPYVAVYPSTAAAGFTSTTSISVSVPQTQNITSLSSFDANAALMVAETSGSTLGFKNVLGILRISLTGSETIDRIRVSSKTENEYLCGTYNVNLTNIDNPALGYSSNGGYYIDVTFDGAVVLDPSTPKTINVMLPPGTYAKLQIKAYNTSKAAVVLDQTIESCAIVRSSILSREFTTEAKSVPTGAVEGLFIVDKYGNDVYFSQGNLQYVDNTWKFADNQWDFFGKYTSTAWDLFGFSTENSNYGMLLASSNTNFGGSFIDWGTNAISNGGNNPNQWRTLTKDEWVYVFTTRSTPSNIKYAKATVNGKKGVILLPDDWNVVYCSLNETNNSSADFNKNIIDETTWNNNLESHGAVFLPAAGRRSGTNASYLADVGWYWHSTYDDNTNAFSTKFNYSFLHEKEYCSRYYGISVRLVQNVPAE